MSYKPAGVLILEGPSAAGKTTLAQHIRKRYPDTVYVHCTYRFKRLMWHYHLAALRRGLRHSATRLAIIDRQWPSEEIYGHVYRGGTAWPHQGRILQKLILKHAGLHVFCLVHPDKIAQRIAQYRRQYHAPEFLVNARSIAERYWSLWHGARLTSYRTYADSVMASGGLQQREDCESYNVETDGRDLDYYVDYLLAKLARWRQAQYQPALDYSCRNFAGHLQPAKYLLVGDKVNADDYRKCWPFTCYANSTLYMAEAMHQLNCHEEQFLWTNAECPEEHAARLKARKPTLQVVALGSTAATYLTRRNVPHRVIPHPAYGRRFMAQAQAGERWIDQLAKAVFTG